jgi:hypothetical protein
MPMKHYYSTVGDVVLTHSDMEDTQVGRKVRVFFERPTANGFDFAEGDLPSGMFNRQSGFNESETFKLLRYLKNNAPLIWEYAQKGGGKKCLEC